MKLKCVLTLLGIFMGGHLVWAETGKAVLQGTAPDSKISGTATLTDTDDGLKISVQVANVPPGKHGLHIHQFGDCSDTGKAAGGHYNPDGVQHGYLPKDGFDAAHAGDFGNIWLYWLGPVIGGILAAVTYQKVLE